MSVAMCDPEAFYPLRSLVAGPLTDLRELTEVERFIRTVVLHDEISMELNPSSYNPDAERAFAEEEPQVRRRTVIVAMGPVLTGYDFFTERRGPKKPPPPDIPLASPLIEAAREFSNAEEGNIYYQAHIEYLQRIVSVVQKGGSALLAGEFGSAAIGASTRFPAKLFENLDQDWQQFAREADAGELGFIVPPVLSIILTRCARRDAIPSVIKDLRDEWTDARAKVWALIDQLKTAPTIGEMRKIQQELVASSRLLSPIQHDIDTKPGRVLWELIAGGLGGAAIALLSGGHPVVGAVIGAVGTASRSVPPLIHELGPVLFSRGAFDLARRIRQDASLVEYDALARLLTDAEKRNLRL
jgi:hypothetical protein